MKPKIFFFLLLSLYIVNCTLYITHATTRYVSKTGTSTPPYTSWETAADSIQKCINISQFGDIIYVANGVYKEQVIMIPGLSLIGAGMDSCVIDTRELVNSTEFISVDVHDNCIFKGFHILVYHYNNSGYGVQGRHNSRIEFNRVTNSINGFYIKDLGSNGSNIYKNIVSKAVRGVAVYNSSVLIRGNIIFTGRIENLGNVCGVDVQGEFNNSFATIIDSNHIETVLYSNGIRQVHSKLSILNNTIIMDSANYGIRSSNTYSAEFHNNLILSNFGVNAIRNGIENAQMFNNYITGTIVNLPDISAVSITAQFNIFKGNVITKVPRGIYAHASTICQYNNVWNTDIPYSGITPDTTNISVDPMVVNDDTTRGELDFHLQKYSPLIDAGDPDILDRDGSRSDIGLYGGPYGWTYTYNDLAPRPPHNITAVVEDGLIKLTWNKNTEADFSFYRIYRDTVSILIYDSTKIAGETSDTVFYDNLPITNTAKKYYYLITAFDNQGNQSAPGEEVNVTVTGMTEHPPIGDDGYRLLSNYPNPFNPSTIIPYRLKESGYVKLYIYDVKGELVRVMVNQWQNRGYYEVVFQPNTEERQRANSYEVPVGRTYSDIATGVYIYQIMVKSENNIPVFSDTGKMILLK